MSTNPKPDAPASGRAASPTVPWGSITPEIIPCLRHGYTRGQFARDVTGGLVVGIVALPLSLAVAIASGVQPQQGLITAFVAGFIISALGGSRVQIGGPTGAFIVVVWGIVQAHGYEGLVVATLIAGVILIGMGLLRLGAAIQFIPYPVTIGFTSGIALTIAAAQLGDLLGLSLPGRSGDFLGRLGEVIGASSSVDLPSLGVGAATILLLALWPRVTHRIPAPIVALLVVTLAVHVLGIPVQTVGDRFGAIPNELPRPHLPRIDLERIREMFSPGLTIAILAGIESLLSAVIADGMTGFRHRPNAELVGQGVANLVSPLLGGIPATGAIARTATSIRNGGRTPVAGIVHAATLFAIYSFFGSQAARVPLPVLAGILLVVAYHMSEWRHFLSMFRSPRLDVAVLLITFTLTVLVDLTVAIEVGVVLAAFVFMHRMASISQSSLVTDQFRNGEGGDDPMAIATREVPPGVEVFEIFGAFFFGAASKFQEAIRRVEAPPRVLILRLREVHAIDATGLRALEELLHRSRNDGTLLVLSGLHDGPRRVLEKAGVIRAVGADNVVPDIDRALARAREIMASP